MDETTKKCFITAYTKIKNFHQSRAATILTDIFINIRNLKYHDGEQIDPHLMKLEQQFKRFVEAKQTLCDQFQVAITLASISGSKNFDSVFQSASWEEETNLTMSKVKCVLMATQRRQKVNVDNFANFTSKQRKHFTTNKNVPHGKFIHSRQPRDPSKGWECPNCQMINHNFINCTRKRTSERKPQASHQATNDDDNIEEPSGSANVAHAYP